MWTKLFWKDTVERMIASASGSLLSVWLVGDQLLNALEVDWQTSGGIALGAAAVSLLKALAATQVQKANMSPASLASRNPNDVP